MQRSSRRRSAELYHTLYKRLTDDQLEYLVYMFLGDLGYEIYWENGDWAIDQARPNPSTPPRNLYPDELDEAWEDVYQLYFQENTTPGTAQSETFTWLCYDMLCGLLWHAAETGQYNLDAIDPSNPHHPVVALGNFCFENNIAAEDLYKDIPPQAQYTMLEHAVSLQLKRLTYRHEAEALADSLYEFGVLVEFPGQGVSIDVLQDTQASYDPQRVYQILPDLVDQVHMNSQVMQIPARTGQQHQSSRGFPALPSPGMTSGRGPIPRMPTSTALAPLPPMGGPSGMRGGRSSMWNTKRYPLRPVEKAAIIVGFVAIAAISYNAFSNSGDTTPDPANPSALVEEEPDGAIESILKAIWYPIHDLFGSTFRGGDASNSVDPGMRGGGSADNPNDENAGGGGPGAIPASEINKELFIDPLNNMAACTPTLTYMQYYAGTYPARYHTGADYAACPDNTILAVRGGTVEYIAPPGTPKNGQIVIRTDPVPAGTQLADGTVLDQDTVLYISYVHMGVDSSLQRGQRVQQGQVLGHYNAGENHLHLEIFRDGFLEDPSTNLAEGHLNKWEFYGYAELGPERVKRATWEPGLFIPGIPLSQFASAAPVDAVTQAIQNLPADQLAELQTHAATALQQNEWLYGQVSAMAADYGLDQSDIDQMLGLNAQTSEHERIVAKANPSHNTQAKWRQNDKNRANTLAKVANTRAANIPRPIM